eukprot:TRINITY_DN12228_c0_g1_i2.p1 TRINITY_DN12228_c0_g1~~TRINITY_DN12228_c0_g1_i2.p1  ORF type:complete len:259 (+),score=52.91 TRINITY_DN12228_c0_g1_i2:77-853(+)
MGQQRPRDLSVPHRDRVAVFRQFVLENFLAPTGTVLDVAGGKGDLSWLLVNADRLDAVVVDPRPTDHRKISRTALWYWQRRDNPEEQQAGQERQALATMGLAPPFVAPKHLRLFFDRDMLAALQCSAATSGEASHEQASGWNSFWQAALERSEALEPPGHHQPKDIVAEEASRSRVSDPAVALELFRRASLILGFHADQATEPCIDLAVQLRIPFAVCPCCVFAKAAASWIEQLLSKRQTSHPQAATRSARSNKPSNV